MANTTATGPAGGTPDDISAVTARLRSPAYLRVLLVATLIGVPISAAAYYFLQLVRMLDGWTYHDLPRALGFPATPLWWPLPALALGGVFTALAIRYLPGRGGHVPLDGFSTTELPAPITLPGVLVAALASLGAGAVLGPEAPLIALGGGLALCAVRLARRDVSQQALALIAATGSFAAISALLGSPIIGAVLLMEVSTFAGPALGLVLIPGLLASGIGSLVFTGLDALTGLGKVSLTLPAVPPLGRPQLSEFGWALVIGALAAVAGAAIRWLSSRWRTPAEQQPLLLTPMAGLIVAGLAIAYTTTTSRDFADVLFSGQSALGPLLTHGAEYSVPALLLLVACKGLAYSLCLSSFRGGPVFPAMYLGAAGGVALSHLPGLPLVAGAAMGIGAMCVVMLKLPLTSVLLATLLLYSDGVAVMPLVIVAVVVAYVVSARLAPVGRGSR